MGADHQKEQASIRSLEIPAPAPHSLEKGEGLGMEFVTHRAHVMKPPYTSANVWGLESFWLGEHMEVPGEWRPERAWVVCAPSHIPCPVHPCTRRGMPTAVRGQKFLCSGPRHRAVNLFTWPFICFLYRIF